MYFSFDSNDVVRLLKNTYEVQGYVMSCPEPIRLLSLGNLSDDDYSDDLAEKLLKIWDDAAWKYSNNDLVDTNSFFRDGVLYAVSLVPFITLVNCSEFHSDIRDFLSENNYI